MIDSFYLVAEYYVLPWLFFFALRYSFFDTIFLIILFIVPLLALYYLDGYLRRNFKIKLTVLVRLAVPFTVIGISFPYIIPEIIASVTIYLIARDYTNENLFAPKSYR